MHPERRTIRIGNLSFPESIYHAAMRAKAEEERRLRRGADAYDDKVKSETKDGQITFRIGHGDIAKLKMLAHGKNRRYQAYLRDILKREIEQESQREEEIRAASAPRRPRRP